ncbi:MAG TPA: PDGLE domain-containing protein [Mycobacterium sp.]|uniref:PDGLE domain-containing protein n=1 Tax=Mycolicibacterium sp. TaxID=2320850 RepID=UPI0025F14850|nr:PDGLE domain-containing protein [Mycolicibacterium sp.]HPX36290.1 PDGLE domain-containing protein [Mycobacterium sp.]HQC75145.1 PDGLE domain-containing protein [Mycobacterium sp.]
MIGREHRFWVGFLIVTLLIAGGLSYFASASPDGLDSATLQGCGVLERDGAKVLTGQCIAQDAREHALADSPLADYSVRGLADSGGVAGVIGVVLTLAIAGGLFWVLGRAKRGTAKPAVGGD